MPSIKLGAHDVELPPVTIGRLEAINEALTVDGVSHIGRSVAVINAALGSDVLIAESVVPLVDLTAAMKAVLVHAGFKAADPKAEPPAAA